MTWGLKLQVTEHLYTVELSGNTIFYAGEFSFFLTVDCLEVPANQHYFGTPRRYDQQITSTLTLPGSTEPDEATDPRCFPEYGCETIRCVKDISTILHMCRALVLYCVIGICCKFVIIEFNPKWTLSTVSLSVIVGSCFGSQ